MKKCEKQESKTTYNGFKFILKLQCNTESQADKISSQLFKIAQENFFLSCQVRTFRETHIIWKIFLMVLTNKLIYLVDVKTMRKIFSKYVCFSESPNFIWDNYWGWLSRSTGRSFVLSLLQTTVCIQQNNTMYISKYLE